MAPHVSNGEASLPERQLRAACQIRWADITQIFWEVDRELVRAVAKHGVAQTPMNPDMDASTAFIILAEEFGEVAETMTYDKAKGDEVDYEKELIQLAAMAVGMVVGSRRRREIKDAKSV